MTTLAQTTAEPNETDVLYNICFNDWLVDEHSDMAIKHVPSGHFYDMAKEHSENINIGENQFMLEAIDLLLKLSKSDAISSIYFPQSTELYHALDDLYQVTHEAREEGFPLPSNIALENAERLLKEMYVISPRRFEVYPTPDGEVAIDAPGGYGRSVLLLCDSEGGALCLVNMNGDHRRARYSTTNILPDGFVCEALADL